MRITLGLVFVISGAFKLFDLESFAQVVDAFAILPPQFSRVFSLMLSVCELGLGLGLVAGIRGSLAAIVMMLLVFVGVLSHAIFMGYDIDCGCFGPEDPESKVFSGLRASLIRDVFFIIQAAYLYMWQKFNDQKIKEKC